MKVFITGATGFIGVNLVKTLASKGHEITINLRNNKQSSFDEKISCFHLNESNIEDDIQFFKNQNFDGIIHLASLYLADHKPTQATTLVDSNIKFATHILECAVRAKVKWFLNTGTFWQHYQDADYSPVNLYASTKQAFEVIAKYYIETNQILFSTLKLSDTYGPGDTRPKIFNLWKTIAISGEEIEMSSGEQLMDITFIDDVISAFNLLAHQLENKSITNGSVFAVKSTERLPLKEISKIFEQATKSKLNIKWGIRAHRTREVMIPWTKGALVAGWKPKMKLSTGIKKIYSCN